MTFQQIFAVVQEYDGLIFLLIILLGLIKIPPLEVNIWSWLVTHIGNIFNKDIINRIEVLENGFLTCSQELGNDLRDYIARTERERADRARSRILRFSDEVSLGMLHSEEHYNEVIEDINKYELYCSTHDDYKNNKAVMAIAIVKDSYQECKTNHTFLSYNKKREGE